MAGFIRRFGSSQGTEVLTAIEGVVILDLAPPASIAGTSTGVVAMVGEFADLTFATAVSSTGVVTTKAQPVEVFSTQDMLNKVGGFDNTLGDFGRANGNGFCSIRNKSFARLICVPVNLASPGAGRAWRQLPTNAGATLATPVVTMQGGQIDAGREFLSGTNRVHLGKRSIFTGLGHYYNGIDGSMTAAGAAATNTLTSAGSSFLTAFNGGPVPKGAIVVVGQINVGNADASHYGGTYRVQTVAVSNTALVLEMMDGSNFTAVTAGSLPFRVHPQTDADTGGTAGVNAALADTSGYTLPVRVLDANVNAATSLAPTVVPPAAAATTWDSLSGLTLRSQPAVNFALQANVSIPNAPNHASLDALYTTAIDALMADAPPSRDVNILLLARSSPAIVAYQKTHVLAASAVGIGRVSPVSPLLTTLSINTVVGSDASAPGVAVSRDERVIYSWPGAVTFIPEAVGFTLGTADGLTTTDGNLDTFGSGWLGAVMSNLAPERNPGQAADPVPRVLSPILAIQRGVAALGLNEYSALKAAGICGLRIDRNDGPVFQSGITTSLTAGRLNINRRRMADFIEDSLASALTSFNKLPLTQALKDQSLGEVVGFLETLLSSVNPPAQRIAAYKVDNKSGNTPDSLAKGIYVIIAKVQTLSTADVIVLQASVGESVSVTTN
jgi:hypothetical protein